MTSYENCLNYIENIITCNEFEISSFPRKIKLSNPQKKLLKNLIDGKVTDCPRGMGTTFIIQLYASYLEYLHKTCKDSAGIVPDDYIPGKECLDTIDYRVIKNALYNNREKAMKEYNIPDEDVGMFIITQKFNLGKLN